MGFADNSFIGQSLTFLASVFFYIWSINWTTCQSCGSGNNNVFQFSLSFMCRFDRRASDQQAWLDRHHDDLLVFSSFAAMEETLVVTIDQARVVKVPAGTESLVVGNAAIADLTLLKQGDVIITGKGFGETNFIALDAAGNPLSQSLIHVVAGGSDALLVQRGMDRQSYACEPPSRQCLPTVKLGDDAKYFTDTAKQVTDHNAQATGLP